MKSKQRGLGRGLDALFDSSPIENNRTETVIKTVPILSIDPNPNQPRKAYDSKSLNELSLSIKEHGILQPILLVKNHDRYMIVVGERRWRAARMTGLKEIPALIKILDDEKISELSLVENLQRDDLNPVEEALGIKQLMDNYSFTQDKVAKRLSKSRSSIANTLRLLSLGEEILTHITAGDISAGHGRCLASISNKTYQKELCNRIIREGLNVRQTEALVSQQPKQAANNDRKPKLKTPLEFKEFKQILEKSFLLKADLRGTLNKGKITLSYNSRDELETFYETVKSFKGK